MPFHFYTVHFRKTLAQLGEKLCRTPEEFKGWSKNLGHEKVLTTFASYGEVAAERQREIIRELAQPIDPDPQFAEIVSNWRSGWPSLSRSRRSCSCWRGDRGRHWHDVPRSLTR